LNECIWNHIGGCEYNGQECRCEDYLSIDTEQEQELLDRFGKEKEGCQVNITEADAET
jgi:hypothetical protein